MALKTATALHEYIRALADYHALYERYQPDTGTLHQLAGLDARPHVRIYYTAACGECARHLPALARIAEHLPGWTWELINEDEARLKEVECTLSRPIIVVSEAGRVLGAINGNPVSGSLEVDLLGIVGQEG